MERKRSGALATPSAHITPACPLEEGWSRRPGLCAPHSFPSFIYMVMRALPPGPRTSAKSEVLTITKLTYAVIAPKCWLRNFFNLPLRPQSTICVITSWEFLTVLHWQQLFNTCTKQQSFTPLNKPLSSVTSNVLTGWILWSSSSWMVKSTSHKKQYENYLKQPFFCALADF